MWGNWKGLFTVKFVGLNHPTLVECQITGAICPMRLPVFVIYEPRLNHPATASPLFLAELPEE